MFLVGLTCVEVAHASRCLTDQLSMSPQKFLTARVLPL